MDKTYNPNLLEEKIYALWEKSGYFNPDNLPHAKPRKSKAESFCIIMPPPNANGPLHVGHAFEVAIQDLLIRFWRMRGKKALWLPGADHAGFETQVVFDKKLDKEGRNRSEMPREEIYREIWEFTQKNKKIMEGQLRRLGASCDWSREKFTLDPEIVKEVQKTFIKMHEDGLVYRDLRIVNWCPKHKTALSDLEVKYIEKKDPLYFIKYGPLALATVRPETKFGDTALAVNPRDKRYKKYVGKEIGAVGLLGPLKFKVIADGAVDPKFGTGVVKVTPAHDAADFEIWQRHKNEIPGPKIIIDENGRLTGDVGVFRGLKTAEAREKVSEALKKTGVLEKVEPEYVHQVATCYKCGTTLEPRPLPQWFVKVKPLSEKAAKAAAEKKIAFYPERAGKIYLHWLKNIRDWNVSRQIVWGIRIPAWFHEPKCVPRKGREKETGGCKETVVALNKPRCDFCGADFVQDADVFDTWFSSGQWPYLALGYPQGKDLKTFYPTDVMAPGYEIIFFWVARMVMLGLYRTGKIPFRTVYLHGIVRDQDRQKMSKSKGNTVDPLGVAELYGADALRLALLAGTAAGNDPVISEDKIRGYRNFATKIWNVARFVLMQKQAPAFSASAGITPGKKFLASEKNGRAVAEFKKLKIQVTKHVEKFEFHLAAEKLYHYFWHTFADKIIEEAKPRLRDGSKEEKAAAYETLKTILIGCLKMLHPFMPFVTEEIYQKFYPGELLMVAEW